MGALVMSRKGKSKHKPRTTPSPTPKPSSAPKPFPVIPTRSLPSTPPRILFPHYNPNTRTPLPLPAMPKRTLLRRALPLCLASAAGAYLFKRKETRYAVENHEIDKAPEAFENKEVLVATNIPQTGRNVYP